MLIPPRYPFLLRMTTQRVRVLGHVSAFEDSERMLLALYGDQQLLRCSLRLRPLPLSTVAPLIVRRATEEGMDTTLLLSVRLNRLLLRRFSLGRGDGAARAWLLLHGKERLGRELAHPVERGRGVRGLCICIQDRRW